MASKFIRGYKLVIDDTNLNPITINYLYSPFSIDFDIQRNNFSSTNVASIKIYNLSENTRNLIWKGPNDYFLKRKVTLYLGYGDPSGWAPSFIGTIKQAWSFRDGCNFTTQIESFDGGNAFTNARYGAAIGTSDTYAGVASNIINSLAPYGVKKGKIGQSVAQMGNFPRAIPTDGKSWNILQNNYTGFHVDLGIANILGPTEHLSDNPVVISSSNGLLGTPLVESPTNLSVQMILQPQLKISQLVILNSSTASLLNKQYKIIGIKHRGNVSPSVGGQAITNLTLWTPKI